MISAQPGPPDRHRVTLADVAARAGVSRSLASLVIRGAPGPSAASRGAVLRAADEMGYRPDPAAKLLREHHSRMLARPNAHPAAGSSPAETAAYVASMTSASLTMRAVLA